MPPALLEARGIILVIRYVQLWLFFQFSGDRSPVNIEELADLRQGAVLLEGALQDVALDFAYNLLE